MVGYAVSGGYEYVQVQYVQFIAIVIDYKETWK